MRGLYVCAGGLTYKFDKIPLTESVSYFNLGGLGELFLGLSPPKPPVATGLDSYNVWEVRSFCLK